MNGDEVKRRLSLLCGRDIHRAADMTPVEVARAFNALFTENAELRRELREYEAQARLNHQANQGATP